MSKSKNNKKWLALGVVIGALILGAAILSAVVGEDDPKPVTQPSASETTEAPSETTQPTETTEATEPTGNANINLGYGMMITDIGPYTGIYMEDGSDELVTDVLMIHVTNTGTDAIQYAEVVMPAGDSDARFALSTLAPGQSMVVLESSRMAWDENAAYTTAISENVVLFSEEMSLHEDEISMEILDGAVNVTNISGADIPGTVTVYYKNAAVDVLYGGITYRVKVEGGIAAGETRQVMASHLSQSGSVAVFVTIAP